MANISSNIKIKQVVLPDYLTKRNGNLRKSNSSLTVDFPNQKEKKKKCLSGKYRMNAGANIRKNLFDVAKINNNKDKTKIKNILKREYFNNDEKWINSNNPNSEKILTNLTIIKNELIQMQNYDYKAEGEYLVSKYFSDFLYLVEQSII